MKTHEAYIEVDHGAFRGKVDEVIEYLGFGNKPQITQCARKNQTFRGRHLKLIAYIKHKMIYAVSEDGVVIRTGTAEELAEHYNVVRSVFCHYATGKARLYGKYDVTRVEMTEIMEPVEDKR